MIAFGKRLGVYAVLLLGAAGGARADGTPLAGVLENHLGAGRGSVKSQVRYLSLHGQAAPGVTFVAGQLRADGREMLDENFFALRRRGGDAWRVGRFRSAFGHSDWSETYYSGFVQQPLLRSASLGGGLSLNRLDTGIDWRGGRGALQMQVGLIDAHPAAFQPFSARPRHLVARVQTYRGGLILGWNALVEVGRGSGATRLFGLDGRWSAPHVQLRAELLAGSSGGAHPRGYALDVFHHPPGLTRTTFLARLEGLQGAPGASDYGSQYSGGGEYQNAASEHARRAHVAGDESDKAKDDAEEEEYEEYEAREAQEQAEARRFGQLYTVGVKQILSPYFTLELTHSFGGGNPSARDARGLRLQLVTFTRF